MIALERQEAMRDAPRVTARGHLELVDWAPPGAAQAAPPTASRLTAPADPVRRLPVDRWFDRGVLLLFAASAAAIYACLAHL